MKKFKKVYFDEAEIKYELNKTNAKGNDLLASGKVDAYSEMMPAMVQQIANGLDANR